MPEVIQIEVKDSSKGYAVIAVITRVPRKHRGWESVTYDGDRYQLFGGIRTPYFINVQHPLKRRGA